MPVVLSVTCCTSFSRWYLFSWLVLPVSGVQIQLLLLALGGTFSSWYCFILQMVLSVSGSIFFFRWYIPIQVLLLDQVAHLSVLLAHGGHSLASRLATCECMVRLFLQSAPLPLPSVTHQTR